MKEIEIKFLDINVTDIIQKLESLGAGRMGYSTTEVGDLVVENLK